MGLLEDDNEYINVINEASGWGSTNYLRRLFATLLLANQMVRPEHVWAETWQHLTDDILGQQRKLNRCEDLTLSDEELQNFGLAAIDRVLQTKNRQLSDFPTMPEFDETFGDRQTNRLIADELNYDRVNLATEFLNLISSMTREQRCIFDKIVHRIENNQPGLFFVSGFGGSGKTFLWRAIAAYYRSKGEIVLIVASSGIASLLILGGRIAHSRFSIPLIVHEDSTCNITQGSDLAELIIRSKLIIWDESPMMHKHAFEAVDRTLRDILRHQPNSNKGLPFGGKVVVLGGDFRQILPVIPKGTGPLIVSSAINSSYLWSHCEVLTLHTNMRLLSGTSTHDLTERKKFVRWILDIGDGTIGNVTDEEIHLEIPNDLIIKPTEDPVAAIIASTYPDFIKSIGSLGYY